MALYTILFAISIFMIALLLAIIKKMFFHWKEEHKIERTVVHEIERPAVSIMIYAGKCLVRQRKYSSDLTVYDIITKSDISLTPKIFEEESNKDEQITKDKEEGLNEIS